jgi:hypothetical protein
MEHLKSSTVMLVRTVAVLFLILTTFGAFYGGMKYQRSLNTQKPTSYDECIKLKDSILQESYPAVCVTKSGDRFTQPLTPQQQEGLKPPPNNSSIYPGWLTYSNKENEISMQYPPEWRVLENRQIFKEGDLFGLQMIGRSTNNDWKGTDGALFVISNPIQIVGDLNVWAEKYYMENMTLKTEIRPELGSEMINGKEYLTVYTCGNGGCLLYYNIQKNGMLFRIATLSVGPDKAAYENQINQILSTITFE